MSQSEATVRMSVLPTQNQVLFLSYDEYEARVAYLRAQGHSFTRKEEQEIRAALRRINNRQYAAESRLKKKKRLEFLENRVDELERECFELRAKLRKFEEAHFLDQHPLLRKIKEEPPTSLYTPFSDAMSLSLDETLSF